MSNFRQIWIVEMQSRNKFKNIIFIACKWGKIWKSYINSRVISCSTCQKKENNAHGLHIWFREGVKKVSLNLWSWSYPAGGGEALRLVITPFLVFIFFQCSKPTCRALLSPKTKFVSIKKSQLQNNFNQCYHIDLASLILLIKNGYVCLLHFWVNFNQNINNVCFKNYQNLFQDIPDYSIHQKATQKKLRQSQF